MTPRQFASLPDADVAVAVNRAAGGGAVSEEALRLAFGLRDCEPAVGGRVLLFVPTWRGGSAAAVVEDARRGLLELGDGPVVVMDLRPEPGSPDRSTVSAGRYESLENEVARARARYAYVLCIGGSVDTVETLIAAGLTDATVLTVTPGRTTRGDMQRAAGQLRRARGRLLGFVVDARATERGE